MTIYSDTSTLTTAEVDTIMTATSSGTVVNRKAQSQERTARPSVRHFRQMIKLEHPVRGQYEASIKGDRTLPAQGVAGRDRLKYRSQETLGKLIYHAGKIHLGEELIHDQLAKAGIRIDYSASAAGVKRPWGEIPARTKETCVNVIQEKLDDYENNWEVEFAKALWLANSDPKLWQGIDGMLPASANDAGLIGRKSRSLEMLRHNLYPSIATADLEATLDQLVRDCNKRTAGKDNSSLTVGYVGFKFIDALKSLYRGTGINRDYALEKAIMRIGIGIPDNAFMLQGHNLLLVAEPMFELFQKVTNSTIDWEKRAYFFNLKRLRLYGTPGLEGKTVVKPTPYDQMITYLSKLGEYAWVLDQPNTQGVAYID